MLKAGTIGFKDLLYIWVKNWKIKTKNNNMKKLVIIALLFSIKQVNAQICFSPSTEFAVGTGAASVVSADFNGDGFADLAVANNGTGDISILIGTGTGSFGAATNFGVGSGPYSLCTADFNGDGKADLAATNHGSNDVSVMLGNGSGSFGTAVNFAVGTGPVSLTSADFNGDGFKDLATANFSSNNVSIILGNGAGSFGSATSFTVGTSSTNPTPHSITSGDFNGDGKADLATANYGSDNVSVILGTGTGSFGAASNFLIQTGASPYSIICADINGDGKVDLAVANTGLSKASVLIGSGSGSFTTNSFSVGSGLNPSGISVGDFNGDGKKDLAVTNEGSDNLSLLLSTATGTVTTVSYGAPAIFSVGSSPNALINADFNGDGKLDIATANWNTNDISVLLNAPLPAITANASANAVCAGKSDTLTGGGAVSYIWTGAAGLINGVGFIPAATKTYTVTATDANGCTNKATKTITVNALPTLTVTPSSNPVCSGQSCTLSASGAITYTVIGADTIGVAFTPTITATYTVSGTDANGCVNKSVKTLTVSPLPTVMATPIRDTICAGDSTIIVAMGANTYTWSTTATGNNDSVLVKPTFSTIYMVSGTDANGCKNSATANVIVNCAVSVHQLNNLSSIINVYPNPNNGVFVIETNSAQKQLMRVFDVSGKMVLCENISDKTNIDASSLKEGIYSICLTGNEGVINKRLVIVK